ncbi:YrhK, partial [Terribacillus sp. AE2B 122]
KSCTLKRTAFLSGQFYFIVWRQKVMEGCFVSIFI